MQYKKLKIDKSDIFYKEPSMLLALETDTIQALHQILQQLQEEAKPRLNKKTYKKFKRQLDKAIKTLY